jgi:hypothetical protein
MTLWFLPDSSAWVALRLARLAVLSFILATGGWLLVSAVRAKAFRWRGGGPMPAWRGRWMSVVAGIFLISAVFAFWNR